MVFLEVIEPVIEIVFLSMYDEDEPLSTGMIFFMRSYKSKNFVKNEKKKYLLSHNQLYRFLLLLVTNYLDRCTASKILGFDWFYWR